MIIMIVIIVIRRWKTGRGAATPERQAAAPDFSRLSVCLHRRCFNEQHIICNIRNTCNNTTHIRPISLLTLSLLTLLDSNFPGNSLWTWEFHPLKIILRLSQTPEIQNVSRKIGRKLRNQQENNSERQAPALRHARRRLQFCKIHVFQCLKTAYML